LEPDGQLCPNYTSLQDVLNTTIKVYPNPAQFELVIENDKLIQQLTLYNLEGSVVSQYQQLGNLFRMPVEQIKPGCYVLSIDNLYFQNLLLMHF